MRWVRRIIDCLKLGAARFHQRGMEQLLSRWDRKSKALLHRLDCERRQLNKLMGRIKLLGATVTEDLEQVEELSRKHQELVEAMNAKLEVLEHITIPTLEANCRFFQQRYDAEVAVQVRRQVAASPEIEQ